MDGSLVGKLEAFEHEIEAASNTIAEEQTRTLQEAQAEAAWMTRMANFLSLLFAALLLLAGGAGVAIAQR